MPYSAAVQLVLFYVKVTKTGRHKV